MLLHNTLFNAKSKRVYKKWQKKAYIDWKGETALDRGGQRRTNNVQVNLRGRTYQVKKELCTNLWQEIQTLYSRMHSTVYIGFYRGYK